MKYPKISIIIPTFNEEHYIAQCLDSILVNDYPKEELEIFVVDGMSQDKTRQIIKEYQNRYTFIKLIDNTRRIVPVAMNIGIKIAQGDYIVRLDAHSKYPVDYFSKLLWWSRKLNADNVGAVCLTGRKKNTLIAEAIQFVMSDKFGVGNSLFRIGIKEPLEVDTVPFGFYKREVFTKIGLYDERLIRVQDLELNKRLKKSGGKIYLVPDIICTYYPREELNLFANNRFQTGKWIILTSYLTNSFKSISIRHLVPVLFSLIIIISFILGLFNSFYFKVLFVMIMLYGTILFSRVYFIKKDLLLSFSILLLYLTLHFSYGVGSIKGIFEVIYRKVLGEKQ